jgi:rod shape-determining protein MreD
MRRGLIISLTLVLLWAVVSEVNHALAPQHIFLWIAGLFVTFGALNLPLAPGLSASFVCGLLHDANAPVPFGSHALLFAAAHVVIFNIRDRVPREETLARVVIALLANLALLLVFSFLQISRLPSPAVAWPRIVVDLICSQLFIALVAPWFFALQARALDLARPLTMSYGRNAD